VACFNAWSPSTHFLFQCMANFNALLNSMCGLLQSMAFNMNPTSMRGRHNT
jgi:hypothetical protein